MRIINMGVAYDKPDDFQGAGLSDEELLAANPGMEIRRYRGFDGRWRRTLVAPDELQYNSVLFAASEQGGWYDFTDISTMSQDSAGLIPAVVGQPVGRVVDKSGNDNHLVQTVSGERPLLLMDFRGVTFVRFDDTDDGFITENTVDFSGNDEMLIFASVDARSTVGALVGLRNNGSMAGSATLYNFGNQWVGRSTGDVLSDAYGSNGNDRDVITMSAKISTDELIVRARGTQIGTGAGDQGVGNYANDYLNVGRNNAAEQFMGADLYELVVRGEQADQAIIDQIEAAMADKAGMWLENLISYGSFNANSWWVLSGGMSIAGGKLVGNGTNGNASSPVMGTLVNGNTYAIEMEVTRISGSIQLNLGGNTSSLITTTGRHVVELEKGTSHAKLIIASYVFDGDIDNITLRPV